MGKRHSHELFGSNPPHAAVSVLTILPNIPSIEVGKPQKLRAIMKPNETTQAAKWSVSQGNATITTSGLVTGVSAGTVTFVATNSDGIEGSIEVTVAAPSTWTRSNQSYVHNIEKGGVIYVTDIVSSNYDLVSVAVGIQNSNSKWLSGYPKHGTIDGKKCELKPLDNSIAFRNLSVGAGYRYVITATNSNTAVNPNGDSHTWVKTFAVKPDSTYYPTLQHGSSGDAVTALQYLLNANGANPTLDPDGDFGGKTQTAVISFQSGHSLTANGVVENPTWTSLISSAEIIAIADAAVKIALEVALYLLSVFGINSADEQTQMRYIWDYLTDSTKKFRLTSVQAAGVMGNLQAEGDFSPTNAQDYNQPPYPNYLGRDNPEYISKYDIHDGIGWGIAQWTYYTRKQGLLNYIQDHGGSLGDMDTQLGYLYQELTTDYSGMWGKIQNSSSISDVTVLWMMDYEGPQDKSQSAQNTRIANANSIYNKLFGT